MSILAYTGLPGSGKSYDVVLNQVLPALKAQRTVVTNIPLDLDAIAETIPNAHELVTEFPTQRVQAQPELIDEFARPGVVLVLDEVWRLWPGGQKAHQVPEPFRKLLAEHRHMVNAAGDSMQIVLVTQDLAQIGKFARDLVETTFHHKKLSDLGASNSFRVDVYNGPMSGPNPPRASRQREIFGRYDPAVFRLYKSHTMSEAGKSGANEAVVDGRNNIWKRPTIYVGLAFVVACIAWGIPTIKRSFSPSESLPGLGLEEARKPASGGLVSPLTGGASSMGKNADVDPKQGNSGWRVAGILGKVTGGGRVAITNGKYSVTVDAERYCTLDVDLGPICHWEGGEVTMYSDQRYPSPTNEPAAFESPPVVSVAPVPSAETASP